MRFLVRPPFEVGFTPNCMPSSPLFSFSYKTASIFCNEHTTKYIFMFANMSHVQLHVDQHAIGRTSMLAMRLVSSAATTVALAFAEDNPAVATGRCFCFFCGVPFASLPFACAVGAASGLPACGVRVRVGYTGLQLGMHSHSTNTRHSLMRVRQHDLTPVSRS